MSTLTAKRQAQEFVNLDGMIAVDAWLSMPDTKPRYELIEGKLIQKPLKSFAQVKAVGEFFFALSRWSQNSDWVFLVEGVGVRIDRFNGFVPNVLGLAPNHSVDGDCNFVVAPFLVADARETKISKDDASKRESYARGGVGIYVVIDPDKKNMEVFRLDEQTGKYLAPEILASQDTWQPEELPGLKLELENLWMD